MTNASSSTGAVIDLSYLDKAEVVYNFTAPGNDSSRKTVIMYEGGGYGADVLQQVSGSGLISVTARASRVGVGGFSTGGGIGFLAGANGFATDRLVAVEVVLASGECVTASHTNKHSDLFWAFHGGNGQFGIVIKFYQEAAAEPLLSQLAVIYVGGDSLEQAQQNAVAWFQNNRDPFSVVYYSVGFYPPDLTTTDPASYETRTVLAVVRLQDPKNSTQLDYNATFSPLTTGVNVTYSTVLNVPYTDLTQTANAFFPYGFRRGFYGPQTSRISVPFLSNVKAAVTEYIQR